MKKERVYYVYYSYEEWGRGYIGYRSCFCKPEEDTKYFGSYKDKTFKPTKKIIFACFDTKEEAISKEIILHNFYSVDTNLHFANKAKQTSIGFNITNTKLSDKTKQKISLTLKSKFLGKNNPFYGKTHSEDTKEKIRASSLNRVQSLETRNKRSKGLLGDKNPMYGKTGNNNPLFNRPRPEEVKNKISASKLGKKLYTDGKINVFSFEPPGPYFWLKSKKYDIISTVDLALRKLGTRSASETGSAPNPGDAA